MVEKVRVGMRGQVVIPRGIRKRLKIEQGIILEIEETEDGLLMKPYNPVTELKGSGRGIFGEPVEYQRKLREEWKG